MSRIVWFAAGAGVGFVLGTRAGRKTYDDLVATTRKVMEHPTVQEAAGVVQAQATRLYDEGLRKLSPNGTTNSPPVSSTTSAYS